MVYIWHWSVVWEYRSAILSGIGLTLTLAILTIIAGTLLGLAFALLRRTEHPLLSWPVIIVTEVLRDLPILVVLIWLYYVLPAVGILISGITAAFIGLTANLAAFVAETIRSGIESIHRGQLESAIALGYTKTQAMFRIILPQAFKRMLPNLMSLYVHQIKNTSLASIIAVDELLHATNVIISTTYRPLELYTALAFIYLIIIAPFVALSYFIERRLGTRTRTV